MHTTVYCRGQSEVPHRGRSVGWVATTARVTRTALLRAAQARRVEAVVSVPKTTPPHRCRIRVILAIFIKTFVAARVLAMSALPPKATSVPTFGLSAKGQKRTLLTSSISSALCSVQKRKSENKRKDLFFQMLRCVPALGDCCGVPAMQAVDAGRPLRGWMPQQRCAVLLQIQR